MATGTSWREMICRYAARTGVGEGREVDKLFWLDMEMTGLDPETCVIIEVAAVVTDLDLSVLASFEAVVHQPEEVLLAMDDWNQRTHAVSGLLDRIPAGESLEAAEEKLVLFAKQHFPGEKIILSGNSIGQDFRFIHTYMPNFAELLHYRVIDVSSFKEILRRKWGLEFKKRQVHRAIEDVHESIAELNYYLGFFFLPETQD